MLTRNQLKVRQVRELLDGIGKTECPNLRLILRVHLLEELCEDWLLMRAAQAQYVTVHDKPARGLPSPASAAPAAGGGANA